MGKSLREVTGVGEADSMGVGNGLGVGGVRLGEGCGFVIA
jgi:hypothetical protein